MKCDSLLMPYYELNVSDLLYQEIIVPVRVSFRFTGHVTAEGDSKSGNYQFYHMLTTFSFLVLKALGYLKGVIR